MKKILSLLCCGFLLIGCSSKQKEGPVKEITLDIVVENKEKEEKLFDDQVTVQTTGNTLSDFLQAADILKVEMEDGEYGKTIISILGLTTEDWNKGPWWTFSSDTNENCEDGYCMAAASELEVVDGDEFTFTYSSEF